MALAFKDIVYKRPDFQHLASLYKNALSQLGKRGLQFSDFTANFEPYSNYYLYCISMFNLYQLQTAIENASKKSNAPQIVSDTDQDTELEFLKKEIEKAQADYIGLFSKIADSDLKYSRESLEKSSILNHARRIARTYGRVDYKLIKDEIKLIDRYEKFYSDFYISQKAPVPNLHETELRNIKKQTINIYLPDFRTILRQANGTTRARVYYKISQELQKNSNDNELIFKQLVENRKQQARQSNLSYFDYVLRRKKGFGYERKDIIKFKQNIVDYFLPLIAEIQSLRNNRLEKQTTFFYDELKISHINPIDLIKIDKSLNKTLVQSFQKIFGEDTAYVFDLIKQGYWHANPVVNQQISKDIILLPHWSKLFLSLRFDQVYFNLEDIYFSMGKALSDLSGMINLKGITSYEQSPLIRQVSGFAMLFLSMRNMNLFTNNSELFNDLSLIDILLKIPFALAVDTFESMMYSQDTSDSLSISDLWQQVEKNNNIDFNFASEGFFSEGNGWQILRSLYTNPYSSIEFVLALVVILAEQPYRDTRNSLEKKLNQLLITNTELPFVKRLEICGFSSPFELQTIRKASYAVCDMLQI